MTDPTQPPGIPPERTQSFQTEANLSMETAVDGPIEDSINPLRIVPGDRIGPFKVLQLLGEGGFGAVYQCDQEEPVKRRVAVKIIKAGMDTAEVVARFQAERQALAMMDHPSIAKVFEAGSTPEGRPYFVMEYVRGIPITDYCAEHKLDINARLELFAKVCDAVHHAHQKGIIHRDLKPGNILVGTDGGREPRPKIIDFGVAKATSQQLTEQTLFTQLGQMVGTPLYMSPEQAGVSSEDIDTRSDVYSLGVVLYQLICGRLPFGADVLREKGYLEMQRVIREEDPPRPSTQLTTLAKHASEESTRIALERRTSIQDLANVLRRELEWIPLKALRKDRVERYSTAEALADDVRRYLTGDALEAGPESTTYRLRKLLRRHRGPVIATSLVTLALIGGIIGTTNFAVDAAKARDENLLLAQAAQQARADAEEQTAIAKEQAVIAEENRLLAEAKTEEVNAAARALEEQRDQAERSAEQANAFADLLGGLFEGINPNVARTHDKTLLTMILNSTIEKVDAGEVAIPEVEILMRGFIATAYEALQNFSPALEQHERIQALENSVRGEDHPLAVAVGITRARLLSWTGKKEEALELWTITHDRLLEVEGPDSHLSEVATSYIGTVLRELGRVEESIATVESLVETKITRLGPDHPEVMIAERSLAYDYCGCGLHEQCLAAWQAYLEYAVESFGPEHPEALEAEFQIAHAYRNQGALEEAIERYLLVLPRFEAAYTTDHPKYAEALFHLGGSYIGLRRFEDSLGYLEQCHNIRKAIYGPSHMFAITPSLGVFQCLHVLGRYEEAAARTGDMMEAYLSSIQYGPSHPHTVNMAKRAGDLFIRLNEASPSPEYAAEAERYKSLHAELVSKSDERSD